MCTVAWELLKEIVKHDSLQSAAHFASYCFRQGFQAIPEGPHSLSLGLGW